MINKKILKQTPDQVIKYLLTNAEQDNLLRSIFAKLTYEEQLCIIRLRPSFFIEVKQESLKEEQMFEAFLNSNSAYHRKAMKAFQAKFESDFRLIADEYFEQYLSEELSARVQN